MENKDSAPKDVSKSAGEHLDKPTEDTKSFMTSVGEQFDKTAESVTTFVKGAIPCSSDTGKDSGVSTAPEEKKTEARKAWRRLKRVAAKSTTRKSFRSDCCWRYRTIDLVMAATQSQCEYDPLQMCSEHNKRLIFHSGFPFLGQCLCSSSHQYRFNNKTKQHTVPKESAPKSAWNHFTKPHNPPNLSWRRWENSSTRLQTLSKVSFPLPLIKTLLTRIFHLYPRRRRRRLPRLEGGWNVSPQVHD